jgi:hypothetical protein
MEADKQLFDLVMSISLLIAVTALIVFWRLRSRIIRALSLIGFAAAIIVSGAMFWYTHRPLPANEQRTLFEGVEYIREVRTSPVPQIIHVVQIDLDAAGIEFFITPRTSVGGYDQAARTTSQFLSEFDLQIAINGDFFDPWFEYGPFNYYPRIGDGVNTRGISISRGETQSAGYSPDAQTVSITQEHRVLMGAPNGDVYTAISGHIYLVQNGLVTLPDRLTPYMSLRHPRTAIAVDQSGGTLLLVVVDGRQPNYSEGVTLQELGDIIIEYGGYNALNMDGGGSSTLVIAGENDQPIVLNSPIHGRVPGLERPLANHFGVFAGPLGDGYGS